MKLNNLVKDTPPAGGEYAVSDDGMVTVVGDVTTANVDQIDREDMSWLEQHLGGQIVEHRSVRITKPPSGGYRLEVAYQKHGVEFDRIDPGEVTAIAADYADGSDSDVVFKSVVKNFIAPRISRDLNQFERLTIAKTLTWETSNNDRPLSAADFIARLTKHNKNLADQLRPTFDDL